MPTLIHKGSKPVVKPGAPAAKPAAPAAAKPAASAPATKPGMAFLKRGEAAQQVLKQEEKKAEIRKLAKDNMVYDFWLPADGKSSITFLDGNLKNGVLDIPFFHDHNVNMNGKWGNHFICTQDTEPCPLCEGGNSPDYVGVLTVIDHSVYTSKKDNKEKTDNVKLFRAKRDTIKLLQEKAVKRGGLRGTTWDVKRIGDKSARVGSDFDFTEKLTEEELKAKYGKVKTGNPQKPIEDRSKPIDYEAYLGSMYQSAEDLRTTYGFGSIGGGSAPVGSEAAPTEEYDV